IVRQMSFDEVRDTALQVPRIVVVARSVATARRAASDIFGPEAPDYVMALAESTDIPPYVDVVLVERSARLRPDAVVRGSVVWFSHDEPVDRIRQTVVRSGFDLELSLGRTFPALRQQAAMQVVWGTSRANAQFA